MRQGRRKWMGLLLAAAVAMAGTPAAAAPPAPRPAAGTAAATGEPAPDTPSGEPALDTPTGEPAPDTPTGEPAPDGEGGAADAHADHREPLEVWAVAPAGEDVIEVSVYTPGDGVTPDELYRELSGQGVRGLRPPGAGSPNCRIRTAYALDDGKCPPIRWTWSGYADPQVYFRDRTPANWPVREAVNGWNRSPGVDSFWTGGACPRARKHCVEVRSGDFGKGWAGNTTFKMTMGRNFIDGTVLVRLNDRYANGAADRRSTACHELGHALGVGHNTSTASCMYAVDTASDPTQPHASDIDLLRRVIYP
ncbi:hypothetical protein GCM10010123_12000 [Pilimelia anulata]|uniref:Peptidase M10 metallopeptidase domain-containing protein n=1 Tax=Pilimelia anulata TaxID=53371 RepID=A0A8J3B399_9ACTN|nr:matrixin family metalloprotease [Pilimelia anulata]GGJ83915.1 hypothetical protein GCM10010123_12000 [Pilimelia anulata]